MNKTYKFLNINFKQKKTNIQTFIFRKVILPFKSGKLLLKYQYIIDHLHTNKVESSIQRERMRKKIKVKVKIMKSYKSFRGAVIC